jgi:hypothetical protein
VLSVDAESWRLVVEPYFRFLNELGFRLTDLNGDSPWETWAQYTSAESAFRVSRSVEFQRVEVVLLRLVNGQAPLYSTGTVDGVGYWTLFDNVMEARGQTVVEPGGLDPQAVDRQLTFWAASVRRVAPDFLAGDLSAIDEAAAIVDERMRRNPWPPRPSS